MATTPPSGWSRARWRRSSHSANGGNCVEVLPTHAAVAVRDSKDTDALQLAFTSEVWRAFTRQIKDGPIQPQ
jgi:hypothetical protein